MSKVDAYRSQLRALPAWDAYLLANSALPGPRANLELLQAVADEGDEPYFRHLLTFGPAAAPVNSPQGFLAACGTVGLGKLLAQGRRDVLAELRELAADPRWRVREGVAMALQRWGDSDPAALLDAMADWSTGSAWEQRAAVAGLCEPRLLVEAAHTRAVLRILDRITVALAEAADRRAESFRVLRQALGYGWSVAAAALPEAGKASMEKWFASADRDVRWVMRENLKKNRLARIDAGWVAAWQARLTG